MRGEKYEPVFYNKCTSHVSESKNIYLHTWNGTDTVYERNCFYPLRRGFCASAGCFFRRIQFRVHYPVLSALRDWRGIYKIAQKMEYEFTILTMPTNKQIKISFGQICKKKKLTGIIVDGLAMDMPYYEQIKNSEIPCVLVDVALESDHVCEVSVDNEKASFEEVEHLIENGCRNIAMLSGKKTAQVSERRECGYRRALEKYGLHIREEWIEDCLFDQKTAVQKSIELKKSYPEIDAFFCVSDGVAIGAIEGMGQLGVRVPDDVAIAGFDDYTVSQYIHGGITSIKQYPYKMGVACANTVISMIEGNRVPDWIPMEYKLMKRASTKK